MTTLAAPCVRGRCPGVRRPMATGDGLLARLHPPGGRLTTAQAVGVAEAGEFCGNGLLEVTGRGNFQIRGIREEAQLELQAHVDRLGLLEPSADGPHRLTIVSPLAGIDPSDCIDAGELADAIETSCRSIPGLPAKIGVAVDGGGMFPLDDVEADLRFTAFGPNLVAVGLAAETGPLWIGAVPPAAAPEVARALLESVAALARTDGVAAGRVRALPPEGRARLAASAKELGPCPSPPEHRPTPRAGALGLRPGRSALLAGLPFGRCSAAQLAALASLAQEAGAGELRLSFTRGILIPALAEPDARAALNAVRRLGLIVAPDDPRLLVAACPGGPACASGLAPAQADAEGLAVAARAVLARGMTLHVSGCPKGCARPAPADLTLVGQADGRYGIVLAGTARDASDLRLSADAVAARLGLLRSPRSVAAVFGGVR